MTSPSVLPDSWFTSSGDRVEILVSVGDRRLFYWAVRRGANVVEHSRIGWRKRRGAIRDAMRRFPTTEAAA